MVTREGGAQPKEYLAKYGADRVRTVGAAWLGRTFGCAECHDHKFDPITTQDFYSLQSFFADVKQWGVYADYGYTPNPELRGCSNEHPFPPEIEVESRWLLDKAARAAAEPSGCASPKRPPSAPSDPAAAADFQTWLTRQPRFPDAASRRLGQPPCLSRARAGRRPKTRRKPSSRQTAMSPPASRHGGSAPADQRMADRAAPPARRPAIRSPARRRHASPPCGWNCCPTRGRGATSSGTVQPDSRLACSRRRRRKARSRSASAFADSATRAALRQRRGSPRHQLRLEARRQVPAAASPSASGCSNSPCDSRRTTP